MLIFLSLALFLVGICALLVMPLLVGQEFHKQYSGSRVVTCPENRRQVAVSFDAVRAALTRLAGRPSVQLAQCTRWPERADCGRACMPEALQAGPSTQDEVPLPTTKAIYHFPVFIAAFAAWVIGAIWHSQYLFRMRWIEAVGLSRSEVHQMGWQLTPHLLTFGAPLLFAYGVAMVLNWIGKQGPFLGMIVAILMWFLFVGAVFPPIEIAGLSRDLLKLELGYTLIAAAVVGAIIGGLNGKLHARFAH
jgi:Protein of unknown function (DUF1761)